MEFGIFNLMGSRTPEKPTSEVLAEVAEQTRLADELGYAIAIHPTLPNGGALGPPAVTAVHGGPPRGPVHA